MNLTSILRELSGRSTGHVRSRRLFAVRCLVAVLTLLAFYSGLRWSLGRPHDADSSYVFAAETRCTVLRTLLPRDEVVGYVTDTPLRIGGILGYENAQEMSEILEFYRVQYALAPTILASDSHRAMVVGNFQDEANIPRRCSDERLEVVHDFGDGMLLLAPLPR